MRFPFYLIARKRQIKQSSVADFLTFYVDKSQEAECVVYEVVALLVEYTYLNLFPSMVKCLFIRYIYIWNCKQITTCFKCDMFQLSKGFIIHTIAKSEWYKEKKI